MSTTRRGLLIVISGPSGVGKDTLIKRLLELDGELRYSVSCTTRSPRPGEEDGVSYTFVTEERFDQMVAQGTFLEHATYNGHQYGTVRSRVEDIRASGHDAVLKIELRGAEQVRREKRGALFIFVAPPSMDELVRRLVERNSESASDLASRRKIAEREMGFASGYDHIVVNDDLERAAAETIEIIRAERSRQT